jgi:hypothetical protein
LATTSQFDPLPSPLVKPEDPSALFVTYFPHLIARPILRHDEVIPQLARPAIYRLDTENLATGLTILSIALFKKVLLADTGSWASPPVPGRRNPTVHHPALPARSPGPVLRAGAAEPR